MLTPYRIGYPQAALLAKNYTQIQQRPNFLPY
jgi:hypothetical protein